MTLFTRIWIMTSAAIALSVLTAVASYEVIIGEALARHGRADMTAYARLIAHSVASRGPATEPELRRLLATGPLIAVTMFDRDLAVTAAAAVPGLADHDPTRHLDRPALTQSLDDGIVALRQVENTLYIATPVIDSQGNLDGVLAIAVPTELHALPPSQRLTFAGGVAIGVLAMGMIPATALARRVSRPIDTLVQVSETAREGTVDVDALSPLAHRRDEFGRLARGMLLLARTLKLTAERMDGMVETRARELARGDSA